MKRGNTTLEYLCLIAFSAAAIIAMVVYMGRGFQGHVRSLSDQVGAGQYAPGNTTAINVEQKHSESEVVSTSKTSYTYGSEDGSISGSTHSSSENKDSTVSRVIKSTSESLGAMQNDTWN